MRIFNLIKGCGGIDKMENLNNYRSQVNYIVNDVYLAFSHSDMKKYNKTLLDYMSTCIVKPKEVISAKDLRKQNDFIVLQGENATVDVLTQLDVLEEKLKALGYEGLIMNRYPLILNGVTSINLDLRNLIYILPVHNLNNKVKIYIKHRIEGDNIFIDVYAKKFFLDGIIASPGYEGIRSAYLLGTLVSSIESLQKFIDVDIEVHNRVDIIEGPILKQVCDTESQFVSKGISSVQIKYVGATQKESHQIKKNR